MIKFDLDKVKRELNKINKENDLKSELGINLILSNMILFNASIDEINEGNNQTKKYFLYNLNSTIFKQLDKFKIYPINKIKKDIKNEEDDYIFNVIKKNVLKNK